MFNKPFVSFIFKNSPKERLISLRNAFNIQNRIVEYDQFPDIRILKTPLNINYTLINLLKKQSIDYIKKNLGIS